MLKKYLRGSSRLSARMAPEQEGAPEAPRRSAHESHDAHREHAQRVLEHRQAEWDRAKQELDRMQSHLNSALLEGRNVSTAERLLQDAKTRYDESKERYQEAKELYDRAEKRYQELKEDAQRSTTAGESRAAHLTSPSCFLCPQRHPCVCSAPDCRRLLVASSGHWDQNKQLRSPHSAWPQAVCRPNDQYSSGIPHHRRDFL